VKSRRRPGVGGTGPSRASRLGYPHADNLKSTVSTLERNFAEPATEFGQHRATAAEAYRQHAALAGCQRIRGLYARLVQQDTEQGRTVKGVSAHFEEQRAALIEYAAQQRATLPAELGADFAEVDRVANEAVAKQQPLWFTGGIRQQLAAIDEKLALHATLDPAGNAKLNAEADALAQSIAARANSLRELIVRENQLPPGRYADADREAAIAIAKDAWRQQQPSCEVLAVRIPSEAWSRDTRWTYGNDAWTFVDVSTLQGRLIVADQSDAALALDRPLNVRIDHHKGDVLIGAP